MTTDLHKLFPVTLTILYIAVLHYGKGCLVDYCAGIYSERLDEGGIIIGMNAPYCQVITDYIQCLSETNRTCRGNLKYHTLQTLLHRQRKEFSCNLFPESMEPSNYIPTACTFPIDTAPHTMQRYCALFGSRHLRTFNGRFETCIRSGTYPLVNNKHLLIQITHSFLPRGANAVTKVTIIVKENKRCTTRKQYEAGSEDVWLPRSFTDGTIYGGDKNRKAVEIKSSNETHVEILLRHVATKIYIRQHGAYLSVALRIPERIVEEQSDDEFDICTSGCSSGESVKLEEALANPLAFTRCHGIRMKTPLKNALERCSRANVTDAFFDACMFDQLTTDDEMLVLQAADAQQDITDLYFPYVKHYFTGRQNLTLYDSKAGYRWNQCLIEPNRKSLGTRISEQIAGSATHPEGCFLGRLLTAVLVFMVITLLS